MTCGISAIFALATLATCSLALRCYEGQQTAGTAESSKTKDCDADVNYCFKRQLGYVVSVIFKSIMQVHFIKYGKIQCDSYLNSNL